MDSLADYRARHALQYNQRVKEENDKEMLKAAQLAAEETKRIKMNDEYKILITNITDISIIVLVCESLVIMQMQLEEIKSSLTTYIDTYNITKDSEFMKGISDVVLKVFESVNHNTFTKINFNNIDDINASKNIRETMNILLSKVGIQHETDSLAVEYEMDCNEDEEIARRLYLEEENRVNTMPNVVEERPIPQLYERPARRPRAPRPPRAPRQNIQAIVEANVQEATPVPEVQPLQPLEPNNENAPIVPRPRGRPRRRNNQTI